MAEKKDRIVKGTVFSGLGQGAFFTQLDWVKQQCAQGLGFVPFPGTLNVKVKKEYLGILRRLRDRKAVGLVPPTSKFCPGKALPICVNGVEAAIVFPHAEEFTDQIHAQDVIEIIAGVQLKKALSIKDGYEVVISLKGPGGQA